MRIGYLGAGAWGSCVAFQLARQGHEVILWTNEPPLYEQMQATGKHPNLPGFTLLPSMRIVLDIEEALDKPDFVAEAVTSEGVRPVMETIQKLGGLDVPLILTSKGIEKESGLFCHEIVMDVLGEQMREKVCYLSGPSIASEVVQFLPTAIVCAAYHLPLVHQIQQLFSGSSLRIYPNSDIQGVAFGGAMKNVIAVAAGAIEGLGLGVNAKAALMTRGLHEMRKLTIIKQGSIDTLNGLAGMGDLNTTCFSQAGRNQRFGYLIAQGRSAEEAKKEIGMVVEGIYASASIHQLAQKAGIPAPITETVYSVLHDNRPIKEAMQELLQRPVKEERL